MVFLARACGCGAEICGAPHTKLVGQGGPAAEALRALAVLSEGGSALGEASGRGLGAQAGGGGGVFRECAGGWQWWCRWWCRW